LGSLSIGIEVKKRDKKERYNSLIDMFNRSIFAFLYLQAA